MAPAIHFQTTDKTFSSIATFLYHAKKFSIEVFDELICQQFIDCFSCLRIFPKKGSNSGANALHALPDAMKDIVPSLAAFWNLGSFSECHGIIVL